ncbi:MAG: hypothetical protein FWD73_07260 [Polyangiaceae bacterium]|nr:hypothetical protein [Polyangiaceae bacterium]
MIPTWLLLAPIAVQAPLMLMDEFYYHHGRGLGRWERIGHPLDTLTVIVCIAWTFVSEPTPRAIAVYAALAFASCVFVTKDEFVHAGACTPGEQWLHAMLFVGHPLCLASIGLAWPALHFSGAELPAYLEDTSNDRLPLITILVAQFLATIWFCLYQTFYWNFLWSRGRRLSL